MADFKAETTIFHRVGDGTVSVDEILQTVAHALQEKGYDPTGQLIGYLLSGDPTFITNHKDARTLIGKLDRYVILEIVLAKYIQDKVEKG